ncbi:MAG: helix-turn-helix domain-containing protein [Oscillospiraceae bacterium]|nr:helix-turn-helix domain-containing protein [Oscillospiraceae bacterium]
MIALGERIKALRHRDGKTQEALAGELGVTSQAVSRWEKGICYPDMELIPSIANSFGISIDELFGYENERTKKIDTLYNRIVEMNTINNGIDFNLDECIALARGSLIEFPGNEKLTAALASVLYNAGSIRRGEVYIDSADGFEVCDVALHRDYPEWQEAIMLYEKLLRSANSGELRNKAVLELSRLYRFTGEHEKALQLADSAPDLPGAKPLLRINAFDGKQAVAASGEALVDVLNCLSDLIPAIVRADRSIQPAEAAKLLSNVETILGLVFTDGDFGKLISSIVCIQMLRSYYLWLAGDKDGAFEALDSALKCAKKYDDESSMNPYTSPLLKYSKPLVCMFGRMLTPELPDLWPFWDVPESKRVKSEMQADPRWAEWVKKSTDA